MVRRKYMLTKSSIYVTAVLLFTMIFALAGCGGTSVPQNGKGAVSAKLVWSGTKTTGKSVASAPAGVSAVRLAISGTGITTISRDFPAADGKGTLNSVPVGSGLTLTASGLDTSGTVIYQGAVGSVTVQDGITTDVGTITMAAVTPTSAVFTTAMISGKAFNYSDTAQRLGIITFNANGNYADSGGNTGSWSINASGQLVVVEVGETSTLTLTSDSGAFITASNVITGSSDAGTYIATLTTVSTDATLLIGTWGGYGEPKFSFLDSTHYMIVSAENAVAETGVYTGLEYGTYTWDSATGIGTFATQIIDTNGAGGASSGGTTMFAVTGDTLSIGNASGSNKFSRLKSSATNPVVGSWGVTFVDPATGAVLIGFIDDTHCFLAQADTSVDPSGQSGIELGTYTIDANNVLRTTLSVDTNGDWGFQSIANTNHWYTVTVSGNVMTLTEPTASLLEDQAPKYINRLQ